MTSRRTGEALEVDLPTERPSGVGVVVRVQVVEPLVAARTDQFH